MYEGHIKSKLKRVENKHLNICNILGWQYKQQQQWQLREIPHNRVPERIEGTQTLSPVVKPHMFEGCLPTTLRRNASLKWWNDKDCLVEPSKCCSFNASAEKWRKFSSVDFKRWQQKMFFYLTTLSLQKFINFSFVRINSGWWMLHSDWCLKELKFSVQKLYTKWVGDDADLKRTVWCFGKEVQGSECWYEEVYCCKVSRLQNGRIILLPKFRNNKLLSIISLLKIWLWMKRFMWQQTHFTCSVLFQVIFFSFYLNIE